jgi:SPP1 family holin
MYKKNDKKSLIRTGVLLLAMINQGLALFGKSPLPIDNETFETVVTFGFTIVASSAAWWKNNFISDKGKKQKEVLQKENLL